MGSSSSSSGFIALSTAAIQMPNHAVLCHTLCKGVVKYKAQGIPNDYGTHAQLHRQAISDPAQLYVYVYNAAAIIASAVNTLQHADVQRYQILHLRHVLSQQHMQLDLLQQHLAMDSGYKQVTSQARASMPPPLKRRSDTFGIPLVVWPPCSALRPFWQVCKPQEKPT